MSSPRSNPSRQHLKLCWALSRARERGGCWVLAISPSCQADILHATHATCDLSCSRPAGKDSQAHIATSVLISPEKNASMLRNCAMQGQLSDVTCG